MNARKLRVVPDCPQPEVPIKPVVYVAQRCALKPKGTPITANPAPAELHAIMLSQSARTKAGVRAEPWSYEASIKQLEDASRPKRVTVPSPLPSGACTATPPPRERVGRQSFNTPAVTAKEQA